MTPHQRDRFLSRATRADEHRCGRCEELQGGAPPAYVREMVLKDGTSWTHESIGA